MTKNGLSQNQLAKAIGIGPNRIAEIVHNRRRISAGTAVLGGLELPAVPREPMRETSDFDERWPHPELQRIPRPSRGWRDTIIPGDEFSY